MAVADLPQVMEVAASLSTAPQWKLSDYVNALNPESTPHRIALVIVLTAAAPGPDQVQGFAIASLLPPQAELETVAVGASGGLPGLGQRQGFGQRLFRALVGELRTTGACEILLEVRVSNEQAIAFYRSLGFAETARRPRYYTDPIEDAILMSSRIR